MMIWQKDDISEWYDSLEELKKEFTVIKCYSPLQFFMLKGKTTVMTKDNLVPIPDLKYVLFSPQEKRYYLKESREYSLNAFYFYRRDLDFSGDDEAVMNLRRYILDGNIWLLFTEEQVENTKKMLERINKAHFSAEYAQGRLDYRTQYVPLLKESIDLEDYKDWGRNLLGFKTVCRQYDMEVERLWKLSLKN